jgi:hypothetical protein
MEFAGEEYVCIPASRSQAAARERNKKKDAKVRLMYSFKLNLRSKQAPAQGQHMPTMFSLLLLPSLPPAPAFIPSAAFTPAVTPAAVTPAAAAAANRRGLLESSSSVLRV